MLPRFFNFLLIMVSKHVCLQEFYLYAMKSLEASSVVFLHESYITYYTHIFALNLIKEQLLLHFYTEKKYKNEVTHTEIWSSCYRSVFTYESHSVQPSKSNPLFELSSMDSPVLFTQTAIISWLHRWNIRPVIHEYRFRAWSCKSLPKGGPLVSHE